MFFSPAPLTFCLGGVTVTKILIFIPIYDTIAIFNALYHVVFLEAIEDRLDFIRPPSEDHRNEISVLFARSPIVIRRGVFERNGPYSDHVRYRNGSVTPVPFPSRSGNGSRRWRSFVGLYRNHGKIRIGANPTMPPKPLHHPAPRHAVVV